MSEAHEAQAKKWERVERKYVERRVQRSNRHKHQRKGKGNGR